MPQLAFNRILVFWSRFPLVLLLPALIIGISLAWGRQAVGAQAQPLPSDDQSKPGRGYFAAFSLFNDGEYLDALKAFTEEGRRGMKILQARWIDSICYETMIGECYFEMGQLSQALEHYNNALQLYLQYPDWMIRVRFPAIKPVAAVSAAPWGKTTRNALMGQYPNTMLIGLGQLNNEDAVKYGGLYQSPMYYPIQAQEIVRCTTLAIRRRARILGPISQFDPMTADVLTALSRRPCPPNHWSEAWLNVELGMAYLAAGREAQGVTTLKSGVVADGQFDHPLTSVALLELGRVALSHGDYPTAATCFLDASYSAFQYAEATVLEEAFRYGAVTHLLAAQPGIYPPLPIATTWVNREKNMHQLQASLQLLAAENYAIYAQTPQAASCLDAARLAILRRDMGAGRIGGRLSYLNALVFFQQGKIADGDAALTTAMSFMGKSSFWLYHISLVDTLYVQGNHTPRQAMELYKVLLRDPQPMDWAVDPMESLAVLAIPHVPAYEHWFEATMDFKDRTGDYETSIEVADRARRHRFFTSLADGGRVLSLRWILEAPVNLLDPKVKVQRQDLLARYPVYDQLSQQAHAIRDTLARASLAPKDPASAKQQQEALNQLAAISAKQEAALREIAVRREAATMVFPPIRSATEVQKILPPGRAILTFFSTSRNLYGFLLNNERYGYWRIGASTAMNRDISTLLREVGLYGQNRELPVKELTDTKWKQSAARLLDLLLKGSNADFTKKFDELVIVPDGILWHLPFEMLQVTAEEQQKPLISRFRIRYAPTFSLAVAAEPGRSPLGNTAVVLGKLFPSDDGTIPQEAYDRLAKVLPGAVPLRAPLPAPSAVYRTLLNELIVLDEINATGAKPFSWLPVPTSGSKIPPGNTLGDWLNLPWGGPDVLMLPGYHTSAEDSLRTAKGVEPGSEIFLSVCGLMAGGSRTLLISRWRTGGQTSYDLVREFAQELPHSSPAEAWQRAVFLTAASRVNFDLEPRVKHAANDEAPKANHPFFWAGYMLVDPGTSPNKADAPVNAPVLKIKKDDEEVAKPAEGKPAEAKKE
jgi:CHAT domain-containing protein